MLLIMILLKNFKDVSGTIRLANMCVMNMYARHYRASLYHLAKGACDLYDECLLAGLGRTLADLQTPPNVDWYRAQPVSAR